MRASVLVTAPFVLAAMLAGGAAPLLPAHAEVPVPRLSPQNGIDAVALSMPAVSRAAPLSPQERLARTLTVDVSLAVAELYESRNHELIWTDGRADDLRRRLAMAAKDGLVPADYVAPRAGLSPEDADVALTEAALRYAHHATSGRVAPKSVSPIMTIEPPKLDERRFLRRLSRMRNVEKLLDSLHPTHPQFVGLRAALGEALARRSDPRVAVGKGPYLRRGLKSPRVAALRSRLATTVPRGTDPTHFDDALHKAVQAFQRAHGLGADGIVGPRTIAALDDGIGEDPTAELISNMERWRWLPRELGDHHVKVNIPAYRVRVSSAGKTVYDGRVIVGKPGNPTPIFSDEIEHIVVNPYWNVPYSIASSEMLGAIQANPGGYFSRRGYEAVYKGRVVNPASLSWGPDMLRKVRIRQRPGRGNALGAVKFMFPNTHAVYLHDTPTKHLFDRTKRAFSHGCVRVDQPFAFADALLSLEASHSGSSIKRMVGGGERYVKLDAHIPVHLTYFTREVGADGRLVRYADVYGYDKRTQRALGL